MIIPAICSLFWIAFTTFLRAEMLRKSLDPRPDEPRSTYAGNWPMIIGMDIVAIAAVGSALELMVAGRFGLASLMFIIACAGASSIVLASMIGHNLREQRRRAHCETTATAVQEMKEAVAETVPPAVEGALERVVDDFRKPAPDYHVLHRLEPIRRD